MERTHEEWERIKERALIIPKDFWVLRKFCTAEYTVAASSTHDGYTLYYHRQLAV